MQLDETLVLVKPDGSYAEEIVSYRREMLLAESSMDGCGPLRRMEDPYEWLRTNEIYANPETVPENLVQSTQFVLTKAGEKRILGMLQVRHYFNEYLEKYAGHIGYSVRPSERRNGYAAWMLHESLRFCREIGLSRVLVSCLTENEGSRRTILANGGVYETTVHEPKGNVWLERYWITVPPLG